MTVFLHRPLPSYAAHTQYRYTSSTHAHTTKTVLYLCADTILFPHARTSIPDNPFYWLPDWHIHWRMMVSQSDRQTEDRVGHCLLLSVCLSVYTVSWLLLPLLILLLLPPPLLRFWKLISGLFTLFPFLTFPSVDYSNCSCCRLAGRKGTWFPHSSRIQYFEISSNTLDTGRFSVSLAASLGLVGSNVM
jgi:hypothetical protein